MLKSKGDPAVLKIDTSVDGSDAIVASGKFYAQAACDINDSCLSDNTMGAPATMIEYTFQNNNDWYDVSYINGMNLPAVMYPVPATSLDYQQDDPYRCMAAGSDAATIQTILDFQKQNHIKGNSALQSFACENDYASTFTGSLTGFNAVYPADGSTTNCTSASDCAGKAAGATCGLSVKSVKDSSTTLTCGDRIGYWTYAQFCALNSNYANADLGIDCSDDKKRAYALCTNQKSVSDQGPGRSCFNSKTTHPKDTCCGYEIWTAGGKTQPMSPGSAAVSEVDTSFWKTNILPAVQRIKDGCHLAYSYQYDDPFSTFTCATQKTKTTKNETDYHVVLCSGGDDAGIDPPPKPICKPTVPSVYSKDNFTVGAPVQPGSKYHIDIYRCDTSGSCTTPAPPSIGDQIFKATKPTKGLTNNYRVTATKTSGGSVKTEQSCTFTIPVTDCIARTTCSPMCKIWQVATTGAWIGRSIGVPAF